MSKDGSAAESSILSLLAGAYATRGEMAAVAEALGRARDLDSPELCGPLLRVPHQLAEAVEALETFDIERARLCLDVAEQSGRSDEHWALLAPAQAFVDAATGRSHIGLIRLRQARAAAVSAPISSPFAMSQDICQALLHLVEGDVAAADLLVRRYPLGLPAVAMVHALAALITENSEQAVARTYVSGQAGKENVAMGPRTECILLLIRAAAAARLGHDGLALQSMDIAVVQLKRNQLRTPLAFIPADDLEALIALANEASAHPIADFMTAMGVPSLFGRVARRIALTPRELRLLRHLSGTTATLSEIASMLDIAPKTLSNQRTSLYRKLGVKSRQAAVQMAIEQRLLES